MRHPDQRKFVSENMRNFFKDSMVRTEVSTVTRVLDMAFELVTDPSDLFDPDVVSEIRFALVVDEKTKVPWSDYEYKPVDFANFKRAWESLAEYYSKEGIDIAPVVDARELKYINAFDYYILFLKNKVKEISHLVDLSYGNFCDMYGPDVVAAVRTVNRNLTSWEPKNPEDPVLSITGRRLFKHASSPTTCDVEFRKAKNQIENMHHEPVEYWRLNSWISRAHRKKEANEVMSQKLGIIYDAIRRKNIYSGWFSYSESIISEYDVAIRRYDNNLQSLVTSIFETVNPNSNFEYVFEACISKFYFKNNRLTRAKNVPTVDLEEVHKIKDLAAFDVRSKEQQISAEEKAEKRRMSKMETMQYKNNKRRMESERREKDKNEIPTKLPHHPEIPVPVRVVAGASRITPETIVKNGQPESQIPVPIPVPPPAPVPVAASVPAPVSAPIDPVITVGESEAVSSEKKKPLTTIKTRPPETSILGEEEIPNMPKILISDPFADFSLSLTDKEYENLNSSPDFSEYLDD